MSAGDARHGRRDNGLVAAEYAAAGDVDPRVGEHLLDVLALDGIAAYLRPSTDLHPVTRSSMLPGRPTDRLYVDRVHLDTARDYLIRLAEEPDGQVPGGQLSGGREAVREEVVREDALRDEVVFGEALREDPTRDPGERGRGGRPDIDDEWAKIVAGFDTDVASRSWPEAEDLPEGSRAVTPLSEERAERSRDRVGAEPAREEPSLLDGLDTFGANLPDPDEEGYEPPTPPPVPRPSAPTALAVAGIIIGLIVFLKPDLLPIGDGVAMLLGFAAVVGGFGTLVWRLRPGGDDDDVDPDHGARV